MAADPLEAPRKEASITVASWDIDHARLRACNTVEAIVKGDFAIHAYTNLSAYHWILEQDT